MSSLPSPLPAPPLPAGMDRFLPVLVAGLPGVPGFNAFFHLRKLFPGRVFGIAPAHLPAFTKPASGLADPAAGQGSGFLPCDPEKAGELDALFRTLGFRAVLDASGWCALKPCEHDKALARRLNLDIGCNLMEAARRHGARLVRLSTDLVFDGRPRRSGGTLKLGGYREEDPVTPITVYGSLMAEAERLILGGKPDAVVARIALPMGPSFNGHAGAIDWIESRFRKGRPATLYFDEVRSSLYVQDLNRALLHLLGSDAEGLFHVGGTRPMSLFGTAQAVNRLGGHDPDLLMGCLRAAAGPVPPRAGDVSMDCSRAAALLPPLGRWPREDIHAPGGPEWHRDRSRQFPRGSVARHLYGHGWPDAWDHPLELMPAGFRVPSPTPPAATAAAAA